MAIGPNLISQLFFELIDDHDGYFTVDIRRSPGASFNLLNGISSIGPGDINFWSIHGPHNDRLDCTAGRFLLTPRAEIEGVADVAPDDQQVTIECLLIGCRDERFQVVRCTNVKEKARETRTLAQLQMYSFALIIVSFQVVSTTDWGNLLVWQNDAIRLEVMRKDGSSCHKGSINQLVAEEGELITIGEMCTKVMCEKVIRMQRFC